VSQFEYKLEAVEGHPYKDKSFGKVSFFMYGNYDFG
jgi:hypothetical protein